MASFNVAQLTTLLKKMENNDEILHVLRTLAFIRVPAEVAREVKLVEILTRLTGQEEFESPATVILDKLKFAEDTAAELAASETEKKKAEKKEKKVSRKRKIENENVDVSKDSKASKSKKSKTTEQKESVEPKKKEAKPKKAQPTPLMRKCLKQAKGMFKW